MVGEVRPREEVGRREEVRRAVALGEVVAAHRARVPRRVDEVPRAAELGGVPGVGLAGERRVGAARVADHVHDLVARDLAELGEQVRVAGAHALARREHGARVTGGLRDAGRSQRGHVVRDAIGDPVVEGLHALDGIVLALRDVSTDGLDAALCFARHGRDDRMDLRGHGVGGGRAGRRGRRRGRRRRRRAGRSCGGRSRRRRGGPGRRSRAIVGLGGRRGLFVVVPVRVLADPSVEPVERAGAAEQRASRALGRGAVVTVERPVAARRERQEAALGKEREQRHEEDEVHRERAKHQAIEEREEAPALLGALATTQLAHGVPRERQTRKEQRPRGDGQPRGPVGVGRERRREPHAHEGCRHHERHGERLEGEPHRRAAFSASPRAQRHTGNHGRAREPDNSSGRSPISRA